MRTVATEHAAEMGSGDASRQMGANHGWAGRGMDVLFLTLVVVVVYRDFLFGGHHMVRAIDGTLFDYPFQSFIATHLGAGEIPLWIPNLVSGFPTIGFPQYGLFYPLNWMFWLWPSVGGFTPTVFSAEIVLNTWLTAVMMYALVLQLGWHRVGAIMAAVSWSLAPNSLAYIGWANVMPAFIWWAPTMLFIVRMERPGLDRWRNAALAGLCLGLAVLAAPAQPTIQLMTIICMLFLVRTIREARGSLRPHLRRVLSYATVGAIGLGLGAVTLLPVFEFAHYSIRFLGQFGATGTLGRMNMRAFTFYHFYPGQLPGLVIPELSREESAFFNYIGPVLFCAAGFGFATFRRYRNDIATWSAVLAIVSLLYMFNAGLPALFYSLPVLNLIREPAYYASYLAFGASLLGAFGIDRMLCREIPRATGLRTALVACGMLVSLALVAGVERALSWVSALFVVLAATWALCFGATRDVPARVGLALLGCCLLVVNFTYVSDPVWHATPDDAVSDIRGSDYVRRMAGSQVLRVLAPPADQPGRVMMYRSGPAATGPSWYPNIATTVGFYDIFAYTDPMLKAPFQAYFWARRHPRMLSLLDVRTIVTDSTGVAAVADRYKVDPDKPSIIPSVPTIDAGHQLATTDLLAFRYEGGLGHAWLRARHEVMSTRNNLRAPAMELLPELARVIAPGFDMATTVILDRAPDDAAPPIDQAAPLPEGTVSWTRYRPDDMALTVTSDRPAILTVSEPWYPGWHAEVNGKSAPIYRAYGMLRAVVVPAGTSRVTFRFMPASFLAGAVVSVAALGACLLLVTPPRRRARPAGTDRVGAV
jgi:hypothetical protein